MPTWDTGKEISQISKGLISLAYYSLITGLGKAVIRKKLSGYQLAGKRLICLKSNDVNRSNFGLSFVSGGFWLIGGKPQPLLS